MLPCGYPPPSPNARFGTLSPPLSPTPALTHACLVPATTMNSLLARRSAPPGCPGSQTAKPSGFVGFTHFEALILLRVRSHRTRLPRTEGRYSSGLSRPSEAFAFHASDSQTRAHSKDSKPLHDTRRHRFATRRATPPTLARRLPASDLASVCPPWPEGFQLTARDSSLAPRPEGQRTALKTPRHEHHLCLTTQIASQTRKSVCQPSPRSSLTQARKPKINFRQPNPIFTKALGPHLRPSPVGSNPRSSPKALTQLLTRGSSARLQGPLDPQSQVRPLQTEA